MKITCWNKQEMYNVYVIGHCNHMLKTRRWNKQENYFTINKRFYCKQSYSCIS